MYYAIAIALIIAGVLAAMVFGKFAEQGSGKDSLADQAEALKAAMIKKEDAMIAELELRRDEQAAYLARMEDQPMYSVDDTVHRAEVRASLANTDNCLRFLRARRDAVSPQELQQTAATFLEGRM